MNFTEKQKRVLRHLAIANGASFENYMADGFIAAGIDDEEAHDAASQCCKLILRNSLGGGAIVTALTGLATRQPVAALSAGVASAGIVGLFTYFMADACSEVNELNFKRSIRQLSDGF